MKVFVEYNEPIGPISGFGLGDGTPGGLIIEKRVFLIFFSCGASLRTEANQAEFCSRSFSLHKEDLYSVNLVGPPELFRCASYTCTYIVHTKEQGRCPLIVTSEIGVTVISFLRRRIPFCGQPSSAQFGTLFCSSKLFYTERTPSDFEQPRRKKHKTQRPEVAVQSSAHRSENMPSKLPLHCPRPEPLPASSTCAKQPSPLALLYQNISARQG